MTMSQAFLEKVQNHYGEECMKMLNMSNEGYADVTLYTWQQFYERSVQFAKTLNILGV